MNKKFSSQYYGSNISFIDMLFNIIILFVLLFLLTLILINDPAKKHEVEVKADMIIQMRWADNDPNDIDLWLKPPAGYNIGFPSRENSYLHLEHDNRGAFGNQFSLGADTQKLPDRREVISFRGRADGRYVTNVHYFSARKEDGVTPQTEIQPVEVTVELIQINPTYKILAQRKITLETVRDEKTAFSFIIENGIVSDIDLETEEKFIGRQMNVSQ